MEKFKKFLRDNTQVPFIFLAVVFAALAAVAVYLDVEPAALLFTGASSLSLGAAIGDWFGSRM